MTSKAMKEGKRSSVLFVSNLFPDSVSTYRGLDNATLLHALSESFELHVISSRPSLNAIKCLNSPVHRITPRKIDELFSPRFVYVPYIPFFGTPFNCILLKSFLRNPVARLLKTCRVDAIVCSWLYPDGCALASIAKKFRVPLILITQGTDTHHYIRFPVRKKLILSAIDQSCAVVTRSIALGRLLGNAGVDTRKIYPVYNGVDESIFHKRSRSLCRRFLGLNEVDKIFLFTGNFLPVKNPAFLIKAFARTQQYQNAFLVMIGKGPLRNELEKLALSLGVEKHVVFTGPLDSEQVAQWMGAADCLCLSSLNEGLPNVVLEAVASEIPIISTDVGGIGELVNSESIGKLVQLGDMDGYVEALLSVITGEQRQVNAVHEASGFSWADCARKYASIIDGAIKSRGNELSLPLESSDVVCSLSQILRDE